MKIKSFTTVEKIESPTWDYIKDQISQGLEKIAIDRRAAIEIGVPLETIDTFISSCGDITFRRFEKMSWIEMRTYLLGKLIEHVDDPELLEELLSEGDED